MKSLYKLLSLLFLLPLAVMVKYPIPIKIYGLTHPNVTHNYYISNTGSNSANGLTPATAWQTTAKVTTMANSGTFHPGDSILFKRGDIFTVTDQYNGFQYWGWGGSTAASGTASQPIVFSNYGTGLLPNFQFPHPATWDSTERSAISIEGVDYIIVDGLRFSEYDRKPTTDKLRAAWTTCGVFFGERGSGAETNHSIIRNCLFEGVGNAIVITGSYNVVSNNIIRDLGNVFATTQASFGSNGVTLGGSHNRVVNNTISGCWAWSQPFGFNGGAIELYNTNDSSFIGYNTFIDDGGIGEFGANAGNSNCRYDTFAYNKIINCGDVHYINVSGGFAIQPDHICDYNNVIIENSYSRFSGTNFGTGFSNFPTQPSPETLVFSNNGSPTASVVYDLRNNIIINTNNMTVVNSTNAAKTNHQNNLYKLSGGSTRGFTAGVSEVNSTAALFVNETGDPSGWDYHLLSTSPAIGIGQVINGLTKDFDGVDLTGARSAGIYQYIVTTYKNTISNPVYINGTLYSIH